MRRIRVLLVTLLSAAGLLSATGSAAAAPPDGYFYLKFAHSASCVSIPNDAWTNGLYLHQWSCLNKFSQQYYWEFQGAILDPLRTWGRIRSRYNFMCLTVKNGWLSNGVPIVQAPCADRDSSQLFEFKRNSSLPNNYYWMVNIESGKAVNVEGASTANGARLIQYPVQYSLNEYVTFVPV